MKRVILISAAALAATFISFSCQKEEQTGDNPGKGKILTVTASIGDVCQDTRTYIDGTETPIKTYWSKDDKIKLFDGNGNSATYIIDGWKEKQTSATFVLCEKETPLTGTFKCACYPADNASVDKKGDIWFSLPSIQSYVSGTGENAGSFGNGAAPMVGEGTPDYDKGNLDLTFKNACGALQLNLTSSEVITRIDVAMPGGYLCGDAKIEYDEQTQQPYCEISGDNECHQVSMIDPTTEAPKRTARAYYLVLPQILDTSTLRIAVTTEKGLYYKDVQTAITCGRITCLKAKDVKELNKATYSEEPDAIPLMVGGAIWAPVNCGYGMHGGASNVDTILYSYGLLYQWGRLHGGGYNDGESFIEEKPQVSVEGPVEGAVPDSALFYTCSKEPCNWYNGEDPAPDELWEDDTKTDYDPCPAGWRVPTYGDLISLIGDETQGVSGGWDGKNNIGYWFNGTKTPKVGDGLFLPAAGFRNYDGSFGTSRSKYGSYWSSSTIVEYSWSLGFSDQNWAKMDSETGCRAAGASVRCVKVW